MSWVYAYAYRAGADHARCDDVCVCETLGDTIIAAVSDGAGSAEKGRIGASLACDAFVELGVQIFSGTIQPPCLLEAIRARIPEGESDAYSCTLVGVVAGPGGAMLLQVGDGAAVIKTDPTAGAGLHRPADPDGPPYELVAWPEETEFLNHTFFVTAHDAGSHLRVHHVHGRIGEFALFTDGLQHLVLDRKTKTPHQPFFRTIFKPLADKPEHDIKSSWWLERQLGSDHVTKRTDDDTSIVIARRLM